MWQLQKKWLELESGIDWRYVGYFSPADDSSAEEWQTYMSGLVHSADQLHVDSKFTLMVH